MTKSAKAVTEIRHDSTSWLAAHNKTRLQKILSLIIIIKQQIGKFRNTHGKVLYANELHRVKMANMAKYNHIQNVDTSQLS